MKHLLEYESYENQVNEGAIPVYDEAEFIKDTKSKPEMEIKWTQIPAVIEGFLSKIESGELASVNVIADLPTQGKNAPEYVRELMTKERTRMAQRQQAIHGSRMERADRPEDEEDTDEINVFVDSEYAIEGVVRDFHHLRILRFQGKQIETPDWHGIQIRQCPWFAIHNRKKSFDKSHRFIFKRWIF